MKNLTLAIDEAILDEVRVYASRQRTTVNALVRDFLATLANDEGRVREAVRELRVMSEASTAEVGPITWKREDLYDR
jgi:hypothetical protein